MQVHRCPSYSRRFAVIGVPAHAFHVHINRRGGRLLRSTEFCGASHAVGMSRTSRPGVPSSRRLRGRDHRPGRCGRNPLLGPGYARSGHGDLPGDPLARSARLELRAEAFNLLNRLKLRARRSHSQRLKLRPAAKSVRSETVAIRRACSFLMFRRRRAPGSRRSTAVPAKFRLDDTTSFDCG